MVASSSAYDPECNPALHVVDPDPDVRVALGALLGAQGWSVHGYPTARAFLDGFEPSGPSCVVTEVLLPDLDGLELLDRITHEFPRVPVIILASAGTVALAVRAMHAGAASWIQKPYVDRFMAEEIGKALRGGLVWTPGVIQGECSGSFEHAAASTRGIKAVRSPSVGCDVTECRNLPEQ